MEQLIEFDKKLLLLLNSWHTPFLDRAMYMLTETFFWIPLYAIFIFLVVKKYGRSSLWILLGAALTIIVCDQITTSFMKPFFARLRPSHEPALKDLLHIVNDYRGGLYGFASSHAANTFGIAIFIWLFLKRHFTWIWVVFLWAALMTYTRIYLGVHYPIDVVVGALIGVLVGYLSFRISSILLNRYKRSPLV